MSANIISRPILYYFSMIAALGLCHAGRAQAIQQVIGAGGGSSKTVGAYTIDFTIGETVTLTAGSDPACTEGFQQPLTARDLPPDSNLINSSGWYVKVYPNPIHDPLTIHAYMDRPGDLDFRLVDLLGRVLWVRRLSFLQGYNDASLYTGSLARGVYVLYITDPIHGARHAVKLLKE